jgi:hypothetical protein
MLLPAAARAATINVTQATHTYDLAVACSTAAIANLPGTDGLVSLTEAICAANNAAGNDVITLGVTVGLESEFPTSTSIFGGRSATPDVTSHITIRNGVANTINGSASATANFRMFHVASGRLVLDAVRVGAGRIECGSDAGDAICAGGGIYVAAGAVLEMINSSEMMGQRVTAKASQDLISGNGNTSHGGAIYNAGTTILTNSTILDAAALGGITPSYSGTAGAARGGAIYNTGTLTLNNATFEDNRLFGGAAVNATGRNRGGPVYGGAIYNAEGATLAITNSTFRGNKAIPGNAIRFRSGTSSGAAISNDGMITVLTGSLFEDNQTETAFSITAGNTFGGAIDNQNGATIAAITNTRFLRNRAYQSTLTEVTINGGTFNLFPVSAGFGGNFIGLEIDGLIIEKSELGQTGGNNSGGAIYNEGTITNGITGCEFTENEARGIDAFFNGGHAMGGAIGNANGGVIERIQDTTFTSNLSWGGTALSDGGRAEGAAIYNGPGGRIDLILRATFTNQFANAGHGIPEPTTKLFKLVKQALLYNAGWAMGAAISNSGGVPADGPTPAIPAGIVSAIDDSTFTDNFASGGFGITGGDAIGGAIFNDGDMPSIANSGFALNHARGQFGVFVSDGRGGAIMLDDDASDLAVVNSTFLDNKAEAGDGQTFDGVGEGGAIYNFDASVSITDSLFRRNIAQGGDCFAGSGHARGGAVFSWNGPLTILRTEIFDSRVYAGGSVQGGNAEGGGVYAGHDLSVERSRIDGNEIFGGAGIGGGSGAGGGILARNSTKTSLTETSSVVIRDSNLSTNLAQGGKAVAGCSGFGGGVYLDDAHAEVIGTTLAGNRAWGGAGNACNGEGGGLHSNGPQTKVINSTITANRAEGSAGLDAGDGRGGGLFASQGLLYVLNSTVTGNHVSRGSAGLGGFADGAGIFEYNAAVAFFSSVLGGNTDEDSSDNCYADLFSLDYNVFGGNESGNCTVSGPQGNNLFPLTDPLMGLANNGGPGAAFLPPFTHAVIGGGPAHNTGRCAIAFSDGTFNITNTITTDQRGGVRDAQCDIGAFELGAAIVVPADPDFSSVPAPGPLPIAGTTGSPASTSIAVTNVGGASTSLNVSTVSISAGYSVTSGLPISGLGSGASSSIVVQCNVVPASAGTLLVSTNEPGSPQYTYDLTCSDQAVSAPLFSSNPPPSSTLTFQGPGHTLQIVITNTGGPGTLLDVTNISANQGFIIGGLPITALASGESAIITVNSGAQETPQGLLVLQTNEPGNPTYQYQLAHAADIPLADPRTLLLLAALIGVIAVVKLR